MGSTVTKLACRAWLCFAVGLILFWKIAWSLQFGLLPRSGLSRLLLTALWVFMRLKQLWDVSNLWPEWWYLQGSRILLGCTVSDFCWIFLYWSLPSLCSDMDPKTAPKSSTSLLKFLINDVYAGQLKCPPLPPRPWWTPLPVQTNRPCPHPPLLEFYSLVSEAPVIVASLPSLLLLPAAGEAVSVSGIIVFYSFLLFPFWILLNLRSYPCSAWDTTPQICSLRTKQWCS